MTKQLIVPSRKSKRFEIRIAEQRDRILIYKLRHDVYATELGQHHENEHCTLSDTLDSFNVYIVVFSNGNMAGFVSITSPEHDRFSVDKYVSRDQLPFPLDQNVHEIRLLTVTRLFRHTPLAALLMYAAFRWIETRGGKRIIAIGRREVLDIYLKSGLKRLGHEIISGKVTFELLSGEVYEIRKLLDIDASFSSLGKLKRFVDWNLPMLFDKPTACYHGGAFFDAIGTEFNYLERSKEIINADVLDAWFPPSPKVLVALQEYLPWILRTSPPTDCGGMVRAIARTRGVHPSCILPGGGSSDLIYSTFPYWLSSSSRVLLLDPSYGEYRHVLENVIRCQIDYFPLERKNSYQIDRALLEKYLNYQYDLVVLVNPNNPTGQHVPKEIFESILIRAPKMTRVWIDEAYIEYVDLDQSLERFAVERDNIVICKSMSKVYALSGLRAGYLCANPGTIEELKSLIPPWAVSLPAQIAVVNALQDPEYYQQCYEKTHQLRKELISGLNQLQIQTVPGISNFVLCHLPEGFDAATFTNQCHQHNLFIRDVSDMGSQLGDRAIRIAVKDEGTNQKMLKILADVIDKSNRLFREARP